MGHEVWHVCSECDGSGFYYFENGEGRTCWACGGEGGWYED